MGGAFCMSHFLTLPQEDHEGGLDGVMGSQLLECCQKYHARDRLTQLGQSTTSERPGRTF